VVSIVTIQQPKPMQLQS